MNLKPIDKKKIKGRTKVFFHSQKWKETLVFFTFVILASCFWALQYFRQKFDFEIPVTVHYTQVPMGIALSNNLPQEIILHVQDKGTARLNYSLHKNNRSLFIDINLKDIPLYKTSYMVDQSTLYNLLYEKLPASTQLKSFSPEKIEIDYAPLAKKNLPVTIQGVVSPSTGYMFLDNIRIDPAQVTVYGDKNRLSALKEIKTVPLDYKNINKNWNASVDLQAPEGIRLLVNQVTLKAEVEEYTEKTFSLPIVCYNMPANRIVRFFPSTVEVFAQVGLSKYSQISPSDFEIAVNYNNLVGKNSTKYSLTLTRKPKDVINYHIVPDVIEFLVERKRNL